MKRIISILILFFCFFTAANAWVYTTVNPNKNGWNYFYSQSIKIKSENGDLVFKLCVAQHRNSGKLSYFFIYEPSKPQYLRWDDPENAPKNYKKGFIMKVRDGKSNVFDMTCTDDSEWKIEKITQKVDQTLKGEAIFDENYKIDQIEVWYSVSKEDFYNVMDNGFKKIRIETTSPHRYDDYNFNAKQSEACAKTFQKHLKNMMKEVDKIEKRLVESRKKLDEQPPQPQKAQTIEEF